MGNYLSQYFLGESESPEMPEILDEEDLEDLTEWILEKLKNRVESVLINEELVLDPCAVSSDEIERARHYLRTQPGAFTDEESFSLLKLNFEINPNHAVIRRLSVIIDTNEDLAEIVLDQLFKYCLVFNGLLDDVRLLAVLNMNKILEITHPSLFN